MKKITTLALTLSLCILGGCQQERSTHDKKQDASTPYHAISDSDITTTIEDSECRELNILFDHAKHTAIVIFDKDTIELVDQRPASGIWYKNEYYELRGKGNEIQLSMKDSVIFRK